MTTAVLTHRVEFPSFADAALKFVTRFWFVVTVLGQLMFAVALASYYGGATLRGDYLAWGKFFSHGYVPGDRMENLAMFMHVVTAAVVMLSGAVQLVPAVRNRFPVVHRWNGRLYMLAALGVSSAGMYMTWFRSNVGTVGQHIGSTLDAILIWVFCAMALRYALTRDFRLHRRWAMRFFLVVSASLFIRIMLFVTVVALSGTVGFNPAMLSGSLLTFMTFAQYLVPLAILELYFRAQDRPSATRSIATAGVLLVSTLVMIAGVFAASMAIWVPQVKAGFDSRKSIAQELSATIASRDFDAAERRYHELKAAQPAAYNFDESQLNSLGYQLINAHKYQDAIRVFQLNVEEYPKSANVYDSLAEGYMHNGDRELAIANYRKSLAMNPKNQNAMKMLKELDAQ